MSLLTYKKKRSFSVTPEPKGGKSSGGVLRFVVQKHAASHLHYDFRLELDSVLKSWAVPKGPSSDPKIKRLAMMVEDHPYDYRTFEGVIPKGQYGGGTVIVWDEGTYEPLSAKSSNKRDQEKALLKELRNGKIVFVLHGQKLKGEYALVKSTFQGTNSWLLMKVKDKYAKTADITKKEKSVVSGKTLKQVEKTSDNIYGQSRVKPKVKRESSIAIEKENSLVNLGSKDKFPSHLTPMLATLVDQPFDKEGWQYEIKWDGYRCLALLHSTEVELRSRNDKSFNEKFYPIHQVLQQLKIKNAVLDGEVVVLDEEGVSNFGKLQNWRSEADGDLKFYVFDLLWLDGHSLMNLSLEQRREKLDKILSENDTIKISQSFKTKGTEFFEAAKKMKLEGIMAKKMDSEYIPGVRSKDWLKIKIGRRQEVVIGGFTKNDGSSKSFSSLLVGVFNSGKLLYTGKIGTGFSDQLQSEMIKQFRPFISKTSPFRSGIDINKPSRFRPNPPHATATWLKPELVCEVSFTEMTSDGVMRHPSFEGMRIDKKPKEVKEEVAKPAKSIVQTNSLLHKYKMITKQSKKDRKTFLNPTDEKQEREINGHELSFTHLSKLYWPKEKITKRDMLNYYYQVAPFILPYMKDRPQSLNRHPNGITGESFYQKDVTGKVPNWIKTFPYHSEADAKDKNFLVCTDEASLLYIASLGCIEMNPWSSRIQSPENPDWCIIDLDPDSKNFDKVVEAALVTKEILDSANIPGFCKTSGSTGLHIYIPLGAKYNYEVSKEFARLIVTLVNEQLPKTTSIVRATKDRKGKIYLDFLQNRPQATLATAYSIRPKPGATVSMPLHWAEVKKGLTIQDFNINNAIARLKEQGDIFKPVLGKGIDIPKALKVLEKLKS
jgi:bifunctional non-homologous end joining protein LigD